MSKSLFGFYVMYFDVYILFGGVVGFVSCVSRSL